MFGILKGLTKIAIRTVTIPVAAVADVVTAGGVLVGKDQPFIVDQIEQMEEDLNELDDEF